jgi:hypothetical protein
MNVGNEGKEDMEKQRNQIHEGNKACLKESSRSELGQSCSDANVGNLKLHQMQGEIEWKTKQPG